MPLCFILLDNASHRDNDAARGWREGSAPDRMRNMHSVLYLASDTREAL